MISVLVFAILLFTITTTRSVNNSMCKRTVFLEKILLVHVPHVLPSKKIALKNPEAYNIEHLTEVALAELGGYKFVDEEGYDFTDFSDCKTTSTNSKTNIVTINSIENKIGALRIICYNHNKQDLDYFFVPANKLHLVALPCYGKNSHKQRIRAKYNVAGDHYNQFEQYRVTDFVTLAQAKG